MVLETLSSLCIQMWVFVGVSDLEEEIWAKETEMHRSQLYRIRLDTYWIHQIFKGREAAVSVAR